MKISIKHVLLGCLAIGVVFGLGLIIGITRNRTKQIARAADESISKKLLNEINAEHIRENLRYLTAHPHLAGTPADFKQANELKELWESQGLKAWLAPYEVLLSYPDEHNPNRIELQDDSGNAIFTTQLYEKILRPDQNQSNVVPPFNAFSAPGTPKGELLYVNYGRIEDFTWMKEKKSVNFTGKICISRYGKIFRGDKARFAQKFGCSGMILYTDPSDYNQGKMSDVYPDSWWMPPTGVQRGNVKQSSLGIGDPLTPGYPSIESAYRIKKENAELLSIPVHPISYGDAQKLMEYMSGEEAPPDWRGALPITYRLGPGLQSNRSIQMFISTDTKMVTIYNVFAMIKGSIEPDRYVLLGNHRDAWVFGAIDPSSGTASMMELSRVLAKLVNEGWQPRRSIILCSWAAEEPGIIGSREWVEHFTGLLSGRAVAYLNVDSALIGNYTLRARALPLMKNLLYEVGKKIPNPDKSEISAGKTTVYDTWKIRYPEINGNKKTGYPKVPILGSGSDFAPFVTKVGVTCADLRYIYDPNLGISSYPLYHSVYETFHLVNDIMDPGFVFHKAVTQFWGELTRKLADSHILPYDVTSYYEALHLFNERILTKYGVIMRANGLRKYLKYLDKALQQFKKAGEDFHTRLASVDINNPLQVRMMNDQFIALERAFIDPPGLPGRPFVRNVVFAPSTHNSYTGTSFPAVVDALYGIEKLTDDESTARWEDVKKQVSVLTYHLESAVAVLKEYDNFQNI